MWAILGGILTLLTVFGTLELLILTVGGVLPYRQRHFPPKRTACQQLAVIIPAHNEAETIAHCVERLQACHRPQLPVAIYVIADNCTDETAVMAKAAGAEVLIRENVQQRGKGYALKFAFEQLPAEIDAFLIIDADSSVEANFLEVCEQKFTEGADALQCRYTVNNPQVSMRTRLLHVALLAFNVLRPKGRAFWGLSAGISGNGWGIRRYLLEKIPYTAHSVVEDLEYHLLLVKAGIQVSFVNETTVRADMPAQHRGADTQRARWEGGRLRMMLEYIPRLSVGVAQGQWRLLEPLLDLLLLPLALHVSLLIILVFIPWVVTQWFAGVSLIIVALHVLAAIWVGKGTMRDFGVLIFAPFYIIWKITILPLIVRTAGKNAAWVRTRRDKE